MKKTLLLIISRIKARSSFLAGCIDGLKMYRHTKRCHLLTQNDFVRRFFEGGQPAVVGGPFAGLAYENRVYFGPVTPRWLGTYEKELWGVIERIVSFAPEEVVDIGSAEGYYSLGMAALLPTTVVYSYETNPLSIWQQSRLKCINGTRNLKIRRYCTEELLISHGRSRAAIICDIEGSEIDLFTSDVVAGLSNCFVLIEIHPHRELTLDLVCQFLTDRFTASHIVSEIPSIHRVIQDWEFCERGAFSDEEKLELMNEVRGQKQVWLVCEPRS